MMSFMCDPTKESVMQLNQHNPCDMAHCPLPVCVCVCVFNIIDPLKYIIEILRTNSYTELYTLILKKV